MESPFIYKYQPKNFNEIYNDEILIDILKMCIKIEKLHIILVGKPGNGKTTIINIVIREYYNSQLTNKEFNDNVLYINNLKEQGISYYRNELRTFCQTPSTIKGKKKMLILDDIDLINEQSQQVFRNCIDKYMNNVHIISSCTNIQKVIDSILSRLTIIKMNSITNKELLYIANNIINLESIQIEKEALEYIISICNQSIRILINYLEKFKLINKKITLDMAIYLCTNISYNDLYIYTEICKKEKNIEKAIEFIYNLFDKGYSVMDILDNYFQYIKYTNYLTEDEKYKVIPLICKYITIFHNVHEDEIELVFFTNNLIQLFTETIA